MSPPSSGTSARAEPRKLVVSFHDLHPGSQQVCAHFLAQLAALGVTRTSLLVVPRMHGTRPVTQHREFVAWLRELATAGHEICLHGFFHRADDVRGGPLARLIGRCYTDSEGEFHQITREVALDRVRRGLGMLVDDAGLPIVGFTPPAWLLSDDGREALRALGLHYTTTFTGIDFLRRDNFVPAPTIVYSCRNAWRRLVSRGWVRFWSWRQREAPILRVAAHPADFAHPQVEASLLREIRRALASGRQVVTYRDLLGSEPLPARGGASEGSLAVA